MSEMLTDVQRRFLQDLDDFGPSVHRSDLPPQTSQEDNSARQRCKRRGWATYAKGFWTLTDTGREVLEAAEKGRAA